MTNMIGYIADYFRELLVVFMNMAPYFLFGLTVAGVLHVLMKKEFIVRHLQKDNAWSVIKAALMGVPLPLCSCGVVPAALSLRKNKASEGATLAFLISTPQTGADSIIATYGLLGVLFAVYTPCAALFTGMVGGLMTLVWRGRIIDEPAPSSSYDCNICLDKDPHEHSLVEKVRAMARYAYRDFFDDIAVRLAFGIALSALIALVVPDNFFARYVGNDFLSMLLMIAAGIPLYVCATASIPIALAMIDKGLSPGAAFVFLTVGPATNMATITLIASTMGKRVITIYLGVIAGMAILLGTLMNFIFRATGSPLPRLDHVHGHHMHVHAHTLLPVVLTILFSVILAASFFRRARETIVPAVVRRFFRKRPASGGNAPVAYELTIEGMTCGKCRNKVAAALRSVAGVEEAEVDLISKIAKVKTFSSFEALIKAVENAGYKIIK